MSERLAYSSRQVDDKRRMVDNAADALSDVLVRYVELFGRVATSSTGGSTEVVGGSSMGARLPVRVAVLDELAAVERFAYVSANVGRSVLGLAPLLTGERDRASTAKRLSWLSVAIGPVLDGDGERGRAIVRATWVRHVATGDLLGLNARAFRVEQQCPTCGQLSLWADPRTWTVRCGISSCSFVAPINAPILRWSSDQEMDR